MLRAVAVVLLLAGLGAYPAFAEEEVAIEEESPVESVSSPAKTAAPALDESGGAGEEIVTEDAAPAAAQPVETKPANAAPEATIGEEVLTEESAPAPAAPATAAAAPAPVAAPQEEKAPAAVEQGKAGEEEVVTEEAAPAPEAVAPAAAPAAGAWNKAEAGAETAVKPAQAAEAVSPEKAEEAGIVEEETPVVVEGTPEKAENAPASEIAEPGLEVDATEEEDASIAEEPVIETGPETASQPPTETEPVPETELAFPEPENEPAPVFVWSAKARERAFDDFLASGYETGTTASPRPVSSVVEIADGISSGAVLNEAVIIRGYFKRGQIFAAFRVSPENCGAGYVGMITVTRTAGRATSRAVVMRMAERVMTGDLLVPLDDVRAEFERQKRTAARSRGGMVTASVFCLSDGRTSVSIPHDIVQLDRGSADGVALGWLAQACVPGKESELTFGRVVRVGRKSCFIRIAKIYQPLETGDPIRLFFAGAARKGLKSANPETGSENSALMSSRPARSADVPASSRR